jgi:hypothetical protein
MNSTLFGDDEFTQELKKQYLKSVQNGNPNQTILELLKETEKRKSLEYELVLRQNGNAIQSHLPNKFAQFGSKIPKTTVRCISSISKL